MHSQTFRLLHEFGFYVGASSGLNVASAYQIAKNLGPGHTVVTCLCDTGQRYFTRLFNRRWLDSKGLLQAIPHKWQKSLIDWMLNSECFGLCVVILKIIQVLFIDVNLFNLFTLLYKNYVFMKYFFYIKYNVAIKPGIWQLSLKTWKNFELEEFWKKF